MSKLKIVAVLAGLVLIASMLMPSGSSMNVRKLYEEAEQAREEKRYQDAIGKYEEAMLEGEKWGADTLVIDEDFESLAKYKIAVCYAEMGKQLEDPTMYEKSLEYVPDLYEKATKEMVREALIFLWGQNFYELEQYEEAEPKFRELLNDYPDSQFAENAYYSLGNLYYQLKQYESSRESFKRILSDFPNSGFTDDAQYFIAKCFFDENNYDQAHMEFERVESVDNQPLVAQSRYYDGLSLLRLGRNQEALTVYQKFIADFPNSMFIPAAYFDIGTIHAKLREYDEATRNYELAIQHTDDDITKSEIQYQIGNNYFFQEDYQSAIDAYRKLMDTYPESVNIPEARFMISEAHWALKDYESALTAYMESLEKDPEGERVVEATYKMGECHYQMGDKEMALEWYDRVVSDFPESPVVKDAIYGKIWSLNDLKRYGEAEAVGREYIDKYKNDDIYDIAAAETQMMLGDIKFDAGDYVAAADEYLRVVSDYRDLPKFDPFKSRSLLQAGYSYYKEAEENDWEISLLSNAADAFAQLLDLYETNFDKDTREFESRIDYVIPSIINLGLSYSKMQEFEKARAALDLMPKTSADYGRAMFLKGETFTDEGKISEAVGVYEQMIADESLSETWRSRAAIEMATRQREIGQYAEAVLSYQRVVEDYPESEFVSTAMYFVGSSYYDMEPKTPENMTNAITAFQKVLDEHPDSEVAPWSYLGIVAAHETNGDYDMVIKVAEEIETQYADSDTLDARQVIDHARRRKVDAMLKLETGVSTDVLIAELRKVVDDPVGEESGKLAAQSRIGKLLFDDKRYEESIGEYEALLEKFPGQQAGAAYYQIAAGAYWIEDYEKSVASARKGLEEQNLTQILETGLNYTMGLAQNKLASANDSITALKVAIQVGTGSEDAGTKSMVFAAHRELAGVYRAAKMYAEAVQEYKFLAENSPEDSEKADANFWLARTYDENLQDYANAVNAYNVVGQIGTSDILKAQSLYYSGIVYSTHLKDDTNALSSFQALTTDYAGSDDSNIQLMVTDADLRIPELLVKLGKFDEAVTRARSVRDAKVESGDKQEKINAQYQLAYLLGEQANKTTEAGSTDPELSRKAASEYAEVYELSKPLSQMPDDIKTLASASIYNAGYLLYGLETYDDYKQSVAYFKSFTNNFPKNESYSAALEYLGFASFEMARLQADLDGFAKAGVNFLRFAREFPNNTDAAMAQYQAGEAYFAVGGGHLSKSDEITDPNEKAREVVLATDAYQKAASAYRGVVDKYGSSEYAPEALYAMAASYTYISQASNDAVKQQDALDKMGTAYRELSEKYPQSEHAAKAFLSVGNDYYNQAAAPGLATENKTDLYKNSLDNYRKALQVPGIESKTRMSVEAFIRETEELLARDTYNAGAGLVPFDIDIELKRASAPQAIPLFKEVINTLPNTDYADLSYVQLGLCYEYLEKWQEGLDAYGELLTKYMDENGNTILPFSENVVQALQFARDRKAKIMAYLISIKAREESQ